MSLIVSDTHGNYKKISAFLDYKPEEEHIHAGDSLDSFIANDGELIQCFNTLVNSNCILLWGNHELHYLSNPPFTCTGFRDIGKMMDVDEHTVKYVNTYTDLVEKHKHRFVASAVRDGFIITHAGVHKNFMKDISHIKELDIILNNRMKDFLIDKKNYSSIFDISYARGGSSMVGGIFWIDYKHEKLDKRINQIFGHTCSKEPKLIKQKLKGGITNLHVCTDTPRWFCFNTLTKLFEDFFPEEELLNRDYLERHF